MLHSKHGCVVADYIKDINGICFNMCVMLREHLVCLEDMLVGCRVVVSDRDVCQDSIHMDAGLREEPGFLRL